MKEITIGILGFGSFAKRRIVPALFEEKRLKCVVVQKRTHEDCSFPIVSSREELLSKVDAVLITSPNHCHFEDALACAKAKKPTLCEKPLAPTSKEISILLAAFKETNTSLFVGQSLRFKPAVRQAKEILKSGKLGTLLRMHLYFSIPVDKSNWRYQKEASGGVLNDLGVHLIDLVHFVTEEEISFHSADVQFENGVDTSVTALLKLSSGCPVTLECSFTEPLRSGFELIGKEGRLSSQNSLRQTLDPVETLSFHGVDNSIYYYPLQASNIYVEELRHFADILEGKATPLISGEIALPNQKVIEKIILN